DAVDDEDEALVVDHGDIAGPEPVAVDEFLGVGLRVAPVAAHDGGAADLQFAALAGGHFLVVRIDDADVEHGGDAALAFLLAHIVLGRDADADGVGFRHAPARAGEGLLEHGVDGVDLLRGARGAAAADGDESGELPASGAGVGDEV